MTRPGLLCLLVLLCCGPPSRSWEENFRQQLTSYGYQPLQLWQSVKLWDAGGLLEGSRSRGPQTFYTQLWVACGATADSAEIHEGPGPSLLSINNSQDFKISGNAGLPGGSLLPILPDLVLVGDHSKAVSFTVAIKDIKIRRLDGYDADKLLENCPATARTKVAAMDLVASVLLGTLTLTFKDEKHDNVAVSVGWKGHGAGGEVHFNTNADGSISTVDPLVYGYQIRAH